MLSTRRIPTLSEVLVPVGTLRDVMLVACASCIAGLSAQAEIRLPWTPVPITLQPLAVFLLGAALGSRRAALSMLLYLAEGAAGLPFFAGGASGLGHLVGPTGGYLLGFVPSAFVIGWCAERGWDRSPLHAFAAMFLGSLLLFGCGLLQLAAFVPPERLLDAGLYPFVAGDVLKMAAAALLLPGAWAVLKKCGFGARGR